MIGGLIGAAVGWVVGGKAVEAIEKKAAEMGGQWAPDPYGHSVLRWWDGTKWTKHVLNKGPKVDEYLAYQRGLEEGRKSPPPQ